MRATLSARVANRRAGALALGVLWASSVLAQPRPLPPSVPPPVPQSVQSQPSSSRSEPAASASPATAALATPAAGREAAATASLATLFEAARATGRDGVPDLRRFAALERAPASADAAALWPLQAFLLAEAHRLKGDDARALAIHRAVVEWAATDPYGDGSGGSALAVFSLWRWLGAVGGEDTADAARFELAWRYWARRGSLAQAVFEASPIVGALPQLREDLLRRMVLLAWTSGARGPAHQLLAEYLAVTRADPLEPALQRIFDDAAAQGAIVRQRTLLELGKRLERLGRSEPARRLFLEAGGAPDADVAAEARLQLAQTLRRDDGRACVTPQLHAEIEAIVAATRDAELRQRAWLLRARRHLQAGCPIDGAAFERDLGRLLGEYPRARATFDAVMVAAEHHLDLHLAGTDAGALDAALARYAQARQLAVDAADATGEGFLRAPTARTLDLVGRAWFKPALWLHARGQAADRREALALLEDLLARWPAGPLRLAAGFWRGRLLAEAGSASQAKAQFEAVVADSPYDYHALRARLRLQQGDKARTAVAPDDALAQAIVRTSLQGVRPPAPAASAPPREAGPALRRLQVALAADVYRRALASAQTLRAERLPGRSIDDVPLEEIEQTGRWVDVAVALSLRRDAAAAAGAAPEGRLAVAELVGRWPEAGGPGGDWTMAVTLSGGPASLQHDPRYLAVAYPRAFTLPIVREAARASLPPELLYAVMRTETAFDPAAQSPRSALGLFQFMPATFRMLNQRWKLVPETDTRTMESFLLTPEKNIALGARWFAEDLLPREGGQALFALMGHNAGPANVRRWKAVWTRAGRIDDTEFVVDTVPFDETRAFTRRALTAWWIAEATGAARAANAPAR